MYDPKCILIVDDEPNVRLMLRTALESAGYRILEAADGLQALARVQAERCDVVLLDLRMPKLDGMGTLARMRENGHATPVVMLTAHGSIPDAVAAMRLGAIDFLTKPITPSALRAVVSEVLRLHDADPPPEPASIKPPSAGRRSFAFELARARRAIDRGRFEEAELLLRGVTADSRESVEARELLDRLLAAEDRTARGTFPLLREWFPG